MQDTTRTTARDDNNVWKGFTAGLIGGLAASWTMNRFQDVWSQVAKSSEAGPGSGSKTDVPDDTTVKAASAVSEGVFGHKLTPGEKKIGGTAVHYLLGAGVGGLVSTDSSAVSTPRFPELPTMDGFQRATTLWIRVR